MNGKKLVHAHPLVAETAVAMCHELYDVMMSDNLWYDLWKKKHPGLSPKGLENAFVKKNVNQILPQARATLAGMLAQPIDEGLKERIHEALCLDKTLVKGRANPATVVGTVTKH